VRRTRLRALADRLGILAGYIDQGGREVRTTDWTREALLAVMGFDAPDENAAAGWLAELDHERRHTVLEPVRVVQRDAADAARVRVQLPPEIPRARVELTLLEEGGHQWRVHADVRRSAVLELPTRSPYGYHRIHASVTGAKGALEAEQAFIVVPSSCVTPRLLLGGAKAMGVVANLYAQRREHDWGVGDFTTLAQIVEWAGARGADFVGINPLHALFNRGMDVSPYSPVSRLFRNSIYIDVEQVPEFERSEAARALLNTPGVRDALRAARATELVDYDGVVGLKHRVLAHLHEAFQSATPERRAQYESFVRAREPELTRYATWMAIAEQSGVPDWRQWPESLREPGRPGVAAFARAHPGQVDLHRWLQFEADRQMREVAVRARVLGMRIGVYQDLAVGTSPGGSDTWSYPDLFLTGAAIGAPPDPYAAQGQNWGLRPMDPRTLRAQHYRFWIQLLRRAFEHAGALRIDHVLGLFRSFWIPDGASGKAGAYVRCPVDDLLGILALESVRHNALVVGEDLGTVPKEVPRTLERWGLLSSKVLLFERSKGGFRPARRYKALALAVATTHDMAPLAGYWSETDIALRERVGLLPTPTAVRHARGERAADKKALLALLRLRPPRQFEEALFPRRLTAAVHEFLCSTPSDLVGQSLDDLAGETVPVNAPGVGPDVYPSWRRKSRMTMEEVSWSFEVDEAMRCRVRRGRQP
jgi:4-alpha-glucanotransferase